MAASKETTRVPVTPVQLVLDHPDPVVIDLRSPSEFADDHLPGAVNVPLFDDLERAVVGTLYAQDSPEQAFKHGVGVVETKVCELVEEVARTAGFSVDASDVLSNVRELTSGGLAGMEARLETTPVEGLTERPIVLHCWRGGLRSRSVIALLRRLTSMDVLGLEGGYKAYRAWVREGLERFEAPPTFVLRGLTGVGKTLVLREIERQRPGSTLDLEGAAGHRSSLLGMVGLEPVSQKTFDTRLADRIERGFTGAMIVEGESRKVGDVVVPGAIWTAMQSATNVLLEASTAWRVEVLLEDYLAARDERPKLREQLELVAERMGGAGELVEWFDAGREPELVEKLLAEYYDPLYKHSETGKEYAARIESSDVARAAREILALVDSVTGESGRP